MLVNCSCDSRLTAAPSTTRLRCSTAWVGTGLRRGLEAPAPGLGRIDGPRFTTNAAAEIFAGDEGATVPVRPMAGRSDGAVDDRARDCAPASVAAVGRAAAYGVGYFIKAGVSVSENKSLGEQQLTS
jgi:hypothetical protein